MRKLVCISTDGAPAMVGRENGLVAKVKNINPNVIAFHCIIHQTVLCAKLNEAFSALMSTMVKLINFLRCKSSLCHRQLHCFLTEVNALHDDLLLHNNIRWLSKGKALRRLWDLRHGICHFLGELTLPAAERYLEILGSNDQMADLTFLIDIMEHNHERSQSETARQGQASHRAVAVRESIHHEIGCVQGGCSYGR